MRYSSSFSLCQFERFVASSDLEIEVERSAVYVGPFRDAVVSVVVSFVDEDDTTCLVFRRFVGSFAPVSSVEE